MRDAPNQIQGNDWVRYGLAPMMITHIVCSCYEEWLILSDIPTRETMLLKPKPYEDRMLYPYNRQVLPSVGIR
jgi:hypothetical protein